MSSLGKLTVSRVGDNYALLPPRAKMLICTCVIAFSMVLSACGGSSKDSSSTAASNIASPSIAVETVSATDVSDSQYPRLESIAADYLRITEAHSCNDISRTPLSGNGNRGNRTNTILYLRENFHPAQSTLTLDEATLQQPENTLPVSLNDVGLVGCIEETDEVIETCNYGSQYYVSPYTVQRWQQRIYVRVFDSWSGVMLMSQSFRGGAPDACPDTISGSHPDIIGSAVDNAVVHEYFSSRLLARLEIAATGTAEAAKPTQIPQTPTPSPTMPPPTPIEPLPSDGMGSVFGRVLWSDRPVVAEVGLCSDLMPIARNSDGPTCVGEILATTSNTDGWFIFSDVAPGTYTVLTCLPEEIYCSFLSYEVGIAVKFDVTSQESVNLGDLDSLKFDLALTFPADGEADLAGGLTVTWEPSEGAAYYRVSLFYVTLGRALLPSGDEGFRTVAPYLDLATAIRSGLQPGEYRWDVQAYNTNGTLISKTADEFRFIVGGKPPILTTMAPTPDSLVHEQPVTLSWDAWPDATSYRVIVSQREPSYSNVSADETTATSFTIGDDLEPGRYSWRVEALDRRGETIAVSPGGYIGQYFTIE